MSDERNYETNRVPQGDYAAPEYEQPNYGSPEYNQNPYGGTEYGQTSYNAYSQPVQEPVKAKTGCATAALVFGIFALLTTLFFINYVFGALSILFGVIYLVRKADIKPKGKVITGLVLSVISLAISTTIWVSAYMYIVNTEITDIVEDAGALMGEEIDGREMMDSAIKEATGNAVDLAMVEDFVGGEVTIERVMNFMDGVSEAEIYAFIDTVENMDFSHLAEDFPEGVTYEALEKQLGKDFTLRDIMNYLEENGVVIEVTTEDNGLDVAPAN